MKALSSLKFTVAIFLSLIVLIALMTIAQEYMGTYQAIRIYLSPWFLFVSTKALPFDIPYFFGGKLLTVCLAVNLFAAYFYKFTFSIRKIGIHFIHAGAFILIAGMATSTFFTEESQIQLSEGEKTHYSSAIRDFEFVIRQTDDPNFDTITAIPEKLLHSGSYLHPQTLPFSILITRHIPNAFLSWRKEPNYKFSDVGIGPFLEVRPLPLELKDDKTNTHVLFLSLRSGKEDLGSWILSNALKETQEFVYKEKHYELMLRPKRSYFPYTIKLISFEHERYEHSQIPKSFSSKIQIHDLNGTLIKEAQISMNDPFTYNGQTFYQSGFGNSDQVSIFYVVKNPIRSFPYICTGLISLGLFIQFFMRRKKKKR